MKCEEKIDEVKEENIKIEDKEEEIKSLPIPEPMPVDHDGKLVDTRIPIDLKPLVKQTSGHFMVFFNNFSNMFNLWNQLVSLLFLEWWICSINPISFSRGN